MAIRRTFLTAAVMLVPIVGIQLWIGHLLSRPVPAAVGAPPGFLNANAVVFDSSSGSRVHGWLSMNDGPPLLLLPGIRANRLSMLDRARFLHDDGYSILLINFQATGESPGDAITFGWAERADVLAAVSFLRDTLPERRIGVLGTSLGGAAALLAAPPSKSMPLSLRRFTLRLTRQSEIV